MSGKKKEVNLRITPIHSPTKKLLTTEYVLPGTMQNRSDFIFFYHQNQESYLNA